MYSVIYEPYSYTSVGFSTSRDQDLQGLNKGRQDAIILNLKEPLSATISYNTTEPTEGPVIATIKATEPVETPEGWTKVNDTTFTKEYRRNIIEDVLLKSFTGEEIKVTVSIKNIESFNFIIWISLLFLIILLAIFICLYFIYCTC